MGTNVGGNWFIGPGAFLDVYAFNSVNDVGDIGSSIVLGGNTIDQPTWGFNYNSTWISILANTQNQQVLLNSQLRFNPGGSVTNSNMVSSGGAIIGKVRPRSGSTLFGHEDSINNKNVIVGYPSGTSTNSPRIVATAGGDTLTTSRINHTYISTPIFIGSMNFPQGSEIATATNTSKTSFAGQTYATYYPSLFAQTKIVHGKTDTSTEVLNVQLNSTYNPYNTGIGLELETRSSYRFLFISGSITRTPVVKDNAGNYITGNRPLLITKRSFADTPATLFQITPIGNTSIGEPLKFPDLSVNSGLTINKATTPTGDYAIEGGTTATLNNVNAGRWYDISN
jgi:hypothetical protein